MYNLKRFLKYLLRFKSYIIFAFIFMSLSVLLSLPLPLLSKYLLDNVVNKKDLKTLNIIGLFLVFVIISQAISSFFQRFFIVNLRGKVIFYFKKKLFDHIQNLDAEFFKDKETGYLMSRIDSDVEKFKRASGRYNFKYNKRFFDIFSRSYSCIISSF